MIVSQFSQLQFCFLFCGVHLESCRWNSSVFLTDSGSEREFACSGGFLSARLFDREGFSTDSADQYTSHHSCGGFEEEGDFEDVAMIGVTGWLNW